MYKFVPIICLTILIAACAGPISQVAEDELAQPVKGEAAQAMFYSLDVNHDGTVAKEELMVIYPDMVILAQKFMTFDNDGNGYIVMEEFVDAY